MTKQVKHLLVLTTCPGTITAKKIANDVVIEKLGACVQVISGVQSFFRWQNRVDTSEELLLIIKTTTERYPDLENRIKAIHPYEVPEVIAIPIAEGLDAYLSWIDSNTAKE
ncbi:MAG: periplasmic divalent cation tolerance protein [Gammaproteobacteria bacterium]|jgi:periplasmic divalent cation tolerance protein